MNSTSREAELRAALARAAKQSFDEVGLDDDLVERLGLDSLTGLRLLAAVEKRFAVRFPDEQLSEFRSLRRILNFLNTAVPRASCASD